MEITFTQTSKANISRDEAKRIAVKEIIESYHSDDRNSAWEEDYFIDEGNKVCYKYEVFGHETYEKIQKLREATENDHKIYWAISLIKNS